jgi:glycosyl hydrolase family 39 (putative alpha-L-iduronidase)
MRKRLSITLSTAAALVCAHAFADPVALQVDWTRTVATSRALATLQVVVNPGLARGGKLHDVAFKALKDIQADQVRYVPWLPYPRQGVAELQPPTSGVTSWDFSLLDPTLEDFMTATAGHPVVLNFSTMPAWLWQTPEPVTYPKDPNEAFWNYTQGTHIKDPTYKQAADYYARLLAWYTKGGFTDELGKFHASTHHYKVAYWEVLNEVDSEHHWTPQEYSKFYDVVTTAMRKVQPDLKFVAIASAAPRTESAMFEYFLDPKNHAPGTPLDFISYHFYATPAAGEPMAANQYTFFDQADGFLAATRYIEQIKHRLSPQTKTALNELGSILASDDDSNSGAPAVDEPEGYWNLSAALYAYLYAKTAALGIDVVGESQLVGYPTQYPSVSMINYHTNAPNARYWALKLLKDNFGPGDRLVASASNSSAVFVQGFSTAHGRKLLLVNKRQTPQSVKLDQAHGSISYVAPSTGDHPPASQSVGTEVTLEPFEVAVVSFK